jgi:hypothetical protein
MTTKRFSPKAGHYTALLSEVQAEMADLRKQLAALELRERSLKGFLLPFYEEGKFEVTAEGAEFLVSYSSTPRSYLDQDKAKALLAKLGKKVPTFSTDVVTFRVTKSK